MGVLKMSDSHSSCIEQSVNKIKYINYSANMHWEGRHTKTLTPIANPEIHTKLKKTIRS